MGGQRDNGGSLRAAFLGLVLMAAAGAAHAQGARCFRVEGEPNGASRRQHVVDLTTVVRLDRGCEYAASEAGPWRQAGELLGRDTDFLEILHVLGGERRAEVRGGLPRFILGRPRGSRGTPASGDAALHTLILRYCSHYLLEEQLGFRARPVGTEGGVRLERAEGARGQQCGADRLELRALEGTGEALLSTIRPDGRHRLDLSERSLVLDRGDWAIYAARPEGRVGLRVAVFRSTAVTTPLRRRLHALATGGGRGRQEPLLAVTWPADSPGVALVPTQAMLDEPLLWAELRTAADAGLLWLARRDEDDPDAAPTVIADLPIEGSRPPSVRIPDAPLEELMSRRYGRASAAMAPTLRDWQDLFDELELCLTPSYLDQRHAQVGDRVPAPDQCALLSELITFEAPGTAGGGPARLCLERGFQVMSASRARREVTGDPECFDLPAVGESSPIPMAIVGDRMTLEGVEGACVLIDDQPLDPQGDEWILDRGGLLEVRFGGGPGCMSRQAVTRFRIAVVDPERDWHPVGLGGASAEEMTCQDEEGNDRGGECPWRAMPHDEDEIFAFVRATQRLEFRFSTSPAVAAAFNRGTEQAALVEQAVPILSGVEGHFDGARDPALVAYVSRDGSCPTGEGSTLAELRRQPPLEPGSQVVDRLFYVFLLANAGDDQTPRCLARATFRVRPRRALATAQAGDALGLEVGLLGDAQAVFFAAPGPVALGLALPLAYVRLNLFPIHNQRWLAFELAGDLVMAASFDPVGVARTGAGLSASLQFGIPPWVPRLVSVGIMLHGAFESVPDDPDDPDRDTNPIWGFYVGLDLSSLIDLAGGR